MQSSRSAFAEVESAMTKGSKSKIEMTAELLEVHEEESEKC